MPEATPSPATSAPSALHIRLTNLLSHRRTGALMSLGARALEAAAKFGLYALVARALGGHDAGRFFLALSVIHIVSTVTRLGLEKPLTRHVAAELAVGDRGAARRDALKGTGAVMAASLIGSALLALGAPWIAGYVLSQPDMAPALRLAALVIPVQNLAYALAYILIGLERSAAAQMVMNAVAPLLCLAALVLGADDLDRLLIAYAGAFSLCVLLGLVVLAIEVRRLRRGGEQTPVTADAARLPSLWSAARPLFVVEVSQAALLALPVLILGAFAEPTAVSVFSIASRLSMLITTVVLSLGAMSAPTFARAHRLRDWSGLRAAVMRNRRLTLIFTLPLIAALALGAAPLLSLLGVSVRAGLPVLWILLLGQLVFASLPSRDLLLAMAGHGRILRRLSLWQLACCVVLSCALTPLYGAPGAALASAMIWIGGAVALAVTARKRLPEIAR